MRRDQWKEGAREVGASTRVEGNTYEEVRGEERRRSRRGESRGRIRKVYIYIKCVIRCTLLVYIYSNIQLYNYYMYFFKDASNTYTNNIKKNVCVERKNKLKHTDNDIIIESERRERERERRWRGAGGVVFYWQHEALNDDRWSAVVFPRSMTRLAARPMTGTLLSGGACPGSPLYVMHSRDTYSALHWRPQNWSIVRSTHKTPLEPVFRRVSSLGVRARQAWSWNPLSCVLQQREFLLSGETQRWDITECPFDRSCEYTLANTNNIVYEK